MEALSLLFFSWSSLRLIFVRSTSGGLFTPRYILIDSVAFVWIPLHRDGKGAGFSLWMSIAGEGTSGRAIYTLRSHAVISDAVCHGISLYPSLVLSLVLSLALSLVLSLSSLAPPLAPPPLPPSPSLPLPLLPLHRPQPFLLESKAYIE